MPKGTPKNNSSKFGPKTQLSQKCEFLSLNTGRSRRRPLGPSGLSAPPRLTATPAAPSPRSAPSPVRLRPPQRATGPLPPPLAPVRSSPTAQSRVPTSPSRRSALRAAPSNGLRGLRALRGRDNRSRSKRVTGTLADTPASPRPREANRSSSTRSQSPTSQPLHRSAPKDLLWLA